MDPVLFEMADRKTRLESYFDTVCKNIQDMVAKSSANNEDKQSICEALNELMKVHLESTRRSL